MKFRGLRCLKNTLEGLYSKIKSKTLSLVFWMPEGWGFCLRERDESDILVSSQRDANLYPVLVRIEVICLR